MRSKKATSAEPPRTVVDPPRGNRTYSRIVDDAILAIRREPNFKAKLQGLTREVAALGAHTKERFDALDLFGKILTSLLLMAVGGAIALGIVLLKRPSPNALRASARAHIAAADWLEAQQDLEKLRTVQERLTEEDRFTLAAPIEAALEKQGLGLLSEALLARRAGRFSDALMKIDELEKLGVATRRTVFAHAETLRLADRNTEAVAEYARYIRLFPATDETDDAMFWRASILKESGDVVGARAQLEELAAKFPRGNFIKSTNHLLEELGARPTP